MAIGSLLVQPQRIQRATGKEPLPALMDDVLELVAHILIEGSQNGPIFEVLAASFEASGARIVEHAGTGLDAAQDHLKGWVQPLLDRFRSAGEALVGEGDSATEVADRVAPLLAELGSLAGSLTIAQLREHTSLVLDVMQTDLGLTSAFLEQQVWATVDDLIARLKEMPPGTDVKLHENRLAMVSVLRRIKRHLREVLVFPQFNADTIAADLFDLLHGPGYDEVMRRIACVAPQLSEALRSPIGIGIAGSSLPEDVAPSGNGHGSSLVPPRTPRGLRLSTARGLVPFDVFAPPAGAPAASEQYAWYATWLLQYKHTVLFGRGDLKKPQELVTQLKSAATPLTRYIKDQLAPETRGLVDAYSGSGDPSEESLLALLGDLNRLIRGPSIFNEERFAGVTIKQETREKIGTFPEGDDLVDLNRMLLENAFPALNDLSRGFFADLGRTLWSSILKFFWWPGDKVYVDKERKRVMWGDRPILVGDNVEWYQAPIFDSSSEALEGRSYYIFRHLSPGFMEGWARHSSWILDGARMIWHLTQIQPSHQVAPILDASYDLAHGLTKLISGKPFSGFDFFGNHLLEFMLGGPGVPMTLASLQGKHTKASGGNIFLFWLTVWANDLLNMVGPALTLNTLRDFSLSLFTLINFRGPGDYPSTIERNSPINNRELDGVVDPFVTLFAYILVKQVSRKDYNNPFRRAPGVLFAIWLAGGLGMGVAGALIGGLVAETAAWAEDFGLWLKTAATKWFGGVWLPFWFMLYSFREGDTDDGKFNAVGNDFKGYPDKSKAPSPYLLPYAEGQTIDVGQGNQGMWSHNFPSSSGTVQTYAYDFALDLGDEILASRPGTVIDFRESIDDEDDSDWNYILIRHDLDDNLQPLAADDASHKEHDKDAGGTVVTTYAEYGHGKKNGVTDAFSRWDTPPASIRGAKVARGMPIMLADDTGTSFYNHLHMHIRPEKSGGGPAGYTIPFVFQDIGGDGVGAYGHWYTSSNKRITAP